MIRSGFQNRSKPLARTSTLKTSGKLKATGARAARMRQGKVTANAAEAAWMAAVSEFCIVCYQQYGVKGGAEVHHLKSGDRRMGHLFSIGLCTAHHRGGEGEGRFISRHPWKDRFEAAYGTEAELLAATQQILNINCAESNDMEQ